MKAPPTQTPDRGRIHTWSVLAAKGVGWLILATVLVLYSWNLFVPDVFGADPIRLGNAFGLVVLTSVVAALLRHCCGPEQVVAMVTADAGVLRQNVIGQFRRPHGVLGRVAGWVMANRPSNRRRNMWTVGLLKKSGGCGSLLRYVVFDLRKLRDVGAEEPGSVGIVRRGLA